jgi:hypothetical protein
MVSSRPIRRHLAGDDLDCVAIRRSDIQTEACQLVGLSVRAVQRWKAEGVPEDRRAGPKTAPANRLSETRIRVVTSRRSAKSGARAAILLGAKSTKTSERWKHATHSMEVRASHPGHRIGNRRSDAHGL